MKKSAGKALFWVTACAAAFLLYASSTVKAQDVELYTSHLDTEEVALYTSHADDNLHLLRLPGMTYWPDGITIEYQLGMKDFAERAAWSWGQRIGIDIQTVQVTSQGSAKSGKVTMVWKTLAEIREITKSLFVAAATRRWSYLDTGYISGAIIYIPSDRPQCLDHTALHEVGHAIGITGHEGAQNHDVMHSRQADCTPALSLHDVGMAPYPMANCHTELLADGSLYLPSIAGFSVILKPNNGRWIVDRADTVQSSCASAWIEDDSLYLSDVRWPTGSGMGQMQTDGDTWFIVWAEEN